MSDYIMEITMSAKPSGAKKLMVFKIKDADNVVEAKNRIKKMTPINFKIHKIVAKKIKVSQEPARPHYRCKCGFRYSTEKSFLGTCPSCGRHNKHIYKTRNKRS